ncbi:MAG: hypothetical protein ACI4QE_03205, partial [Acutalibacteraceae bacterium]
MKKIVSLLLSLTILCSLMCFIPSVSAKGTSFNGKSASVNGYVTYNVYLKTPEVLENFQGYVSYTKGLKI